MLPLVEINHVTRYCLSSAGAYQRIVHSVGNFRSKFSVVPDNKNNRVLLSRALCVIGSLEHLMFKLHISPQTAFSGKYLS